MKLVAYVVRQGDYLTKLAHALGFDAEVIWNHSKNASIRALRADPEILCPGDILYVPAKKKASSLDYSEGSENAFHAQIPKIKVAVRFVEGSKALAGEPCVVEGLSGTLDDFEDEWVERHTDGDGVVSFETTVHVREVLITFYKRALSYRVFIGDLDPFDEPSGIQMRLAHLGYYGWSFGGTSDGPDREFGEAEHATAISAFQVDEKLTMSGSIDDATREALRLKHRL